MFADICVFALAKELYPDIAERILLHRLGKIGIRPLQELLTTELPRLRSKAATLLRILTGEEMYKLPDNGEPLIQEVLNELLTSQKLRRDGYARLCRELTTAKQRATPNLTIVAVLGLFLQRIPREEIAQRLHCSVANVRNYITVIYNYFGISQKEYPVATERHARLVEIAREMGFL